MDGTGYDAAGHAAAFAAAFGRPPSRRYRAPGRINLIGEHTDYNQGWVMPGAIDRAAWVAAEPRADRRMRLRSQGFADALELDLDHPATAAPAWARTLAGVALLLERRGLRLRGCDALITSTVPIGAGLSSSAAVEVACGLAWTSESGAAIAPTELAQLCQQASHEFGGTRCGIMDLYIAVHGRRGAILQLDTRDLAAHWRAWPDGAGLLVCDTGVRHDHASNEYNQRRAECEAATRQLGVASLRELEAIPDGSVAAALPGRLAARVRHVVSENARVVAAGEALEAGDFPALGRLLAASHRSLRDDYEVSCRELDVMAELCGQQPGVYGARMIGGGFGGCVLALADPARLESVTVRVREGYRIATGRTAEIWPCTLAEGAAPA